MWSSKINSLYVRHTSERFCQGDILRDVTVVTWAAEKETADGKILAIDERLLPYAILLTQDCDLEQDYVNRTDKDSTNNDKYLQSLLLCPAYQAEQLRRGEHLKDLGLTMLPINTDRWRLVQSNSVYRYHYLPEYLDFQIPSLVIDFKHYLTIPHHILYGLDRTKSYLGTASELFRENLSARFSQYLSRIGLPEFTKAAV